MGKTIVFIDNAFLSKISKKFGEGKYLKFDIINFSKKLAKKQNLFCDKIFYYVSPPFISFQMSENEKRRKENYDKFVKKLKEKSVVVCEGECQRLKINDEFVYKQKGVDVLLAIDLVSIPVKMKVDRIILIASDSDFVPAVKRLEEFGIKTILYTYYEKSKDKRFSTSNNLIKSVWKYVLLNKEDFNE